MRLGDWTGYPAVGIQSVIQVLVSENKLALWACQYNYNVSNQGYLKSTYSNLLLGRVVPQEIEAALAHALFHVDCAWI